MPVAELPADLAEAKVLSRELEVPYWRLRNWWVSRRVQAFKRGDGRVLLSRAEVLRERDKSQRITPADGEGGEGETDS